MLVVPVSRMSALYFDPAMAAAREVGPIMADAYVRYRAPLYFPDTIHVGVFAKQLREADVQIHFQVLLRPGHDGCPEIDTARQVYSEQQKLIVAEGHGRLVCFNYTTGKKTPYPEEIIAAMQRLQPELTMTS